jgi:hypothetical protein
MASPQEEAIGSTPLAKLEEPEKQLDPPTHLAKATQFQLLLNKCNLPNECMLST